MRTVLIVNDDPDFLDALAQAVELDNYRLRHGSLFDLTALFDLTEVDFAAPESMAV